MRSSLASTTQPVEQGFQIQIHHSLKRIVVRVHNRLSAGKPSNGVLRAAVEPGPKVGAYSASKAAMLSVMKTVALENKDAGLRANVILPGTIDTPANRRSSPDADFSKWVRPAAIASLVTWLAGDAGRDINGAAIPIYGSEI